MTIEAVLGQVEENLEPKVSRKFREVLSDTYAFIRSAEANQAFATVSLDQLIGDQILRNGETSRSNATQYNPYSYTPDKNLPAGIEPSKRANFLGAADTGTKVTKLDRILALTNELSQVITEIKAMDTVEVAKPEEYTDAAEISLPEGEEE